MAIGYAALNKQSTPEFFRGDVTWQFMDYHQFITTCHIGYDMLNFILDHSTISVYILLLIPKHGISNFSCCIERFISLDVSTFLAERKNTMIIFDWLFRNDRDLGSSQTLRINCFHSFWRLPKDNRLVEFIGKKIEGWRPIIRQLIINALDDLFSHEPDLQLVITACEIDDKYGLVFLNNVTDDFDEDMIREVLVEHVLVHRFRLRRSDYAMAETLELFQDIRQKKPRVYQIISHAILDYFYICRPITCEYGHEDCMIVPTMSDIDFYLENFPAPQSQQLVNDRVNNIVSEMSISGFDINRVYRHLDDNMQRYYIDIYVKMRKIIEPERIQIQCINCIQDRSCIPYPCGHYFCDDCYERGCRLCQS